MTKFLVGLLAGVVTVVAGLYAFQAILTAQPNAFRMVTIDGNGDLLMVVPPSADIIRRKAAGGYGGGETIAAGAFKRPACAGVAASGNLLVADLDGNAIREIRAGDGAVKTLATGVIAITSPCSLTTDKAGDIFLFEFRTLKEIKAEGDYATVRILASGQIGRTGGLDADGNLFFSEGGAVKELPVATDYAAPTVIAAGVYRLNGGLAIGPGGDLFVAADDEVKEIPRDGDAFGPVKILAQGHYHFPDGVPIDPDGNLFVADWPGRQVTELLAADGYRQAKPIAIAGAGLAYQAKLYLVSHGIGTTTQTVGSVGGTSTAPVTRPLPSPAQAH